MPLIHCHCLMYDRLEKGSLFLCLSFLPDNVSLRGSGGRNFIPPFMWNQLLEGLFLSNPFPPLFGRISKEWCSLWPPLASKVKVQLIEFSKEQIVLGLITTSSKAICPKCHPS